MIKNLPGFVAILISCLLIGGCATTGSQAPAIGYNFIFTPDDHISKLIKDKKFADAEAVYEREIAFFAKEPEKYRKNVDLLAAELNSVVKPEFESLTSQMSTITWPAPIEQWPAVSSFMTQSQEFLDKYDSRMIFRDSRRRLPLVDELATKRFSLKDAIAQDGAKMFVEYPITRSPNFIEAYPVKLDGQDLLKLNIQPLVDRLAGAEKGKIKEVYDLYGKFLDENGSENFGNKYFRTALLEQCGAQKPTFPQIIQAVKETALCGLSLKTIPDRKIAFLDLTGGAPIQQGVIEFPASIQADLPFSIRKTRLEADISAADFQDVEILVIVDEALATAAREILEEEVVDSEFQSSVRTEPNPEYPARLDAVNSARQDVRQMQIQKAKIDNEPCDGFGCIGKFAAQVMVLALVEKKNETLQQALLFLRQTPEILEFPVYTPYQFTRTGIRATKAMSLNYFIIDFTAKNYYAGIFDALEQKDFRVLSAFHEQDKDREANLSETSTEKDMEKFEGTPMTVPLSSIIELALSDPGQNRPLPGNDELLSEIVEARNRFPAQSADEEIKASPVGSNTGS